MVCCDSWLLIEVWGNLEQVGHWPVWLVLHVFGAWKLSHAFYNKFVSTLFFKYALESLKDKKVIKARGDSRIDKSIKDVRSPVFAIFDFWLDVVVIAA